MNEVSTPKFDTLRDKLTVGLTVAGLAIGVSGMVRVMNHEGGDCDARLTDPASWIACPIIDTGRSVNHKSFNGTSNMMNDQVTVAVPQTQTQ